MNITTAQRKILRDEIAQCPYLDSLVESLQVVRRGFKEGCELQELTERLWTELIVGYPEEIRLDMAQKNLAHVKTVKILGASLDWGFQDLVSTLLAILDGFPLKDEWMQTTLPFLEAYGFIADVDGIFSITEGSISSWLEL